LGSRIGSDSKQPINITGVGNCSEIQPIATDVARSLCVCVFGTRVSYATTAEPIKMPFGGLTHVGGGNQVLDWVQIPHGKGHFRGEMCGRIVTDLCMSALHPPRANVWTNVFATAMGNN